MHFFTWILALWLPIALQLNFKSLETVIDWLIILTNCLNRLQNRKYTLKMDIIKEDEELETTDEFYERIKKMNEQVKQKYECNDTNQDDTNQEDTNQEDTNQDDTNQEDNTNQKEEKDVDLEQYNQEQYYKEMDEMQEQVNKLSQLKENSNQEENSNQDIDDVIQSHDSTPEEYKDIEHIVAKVNSVNNKVYIDESLE